jgi:hypothetical protein
VLKRVNADAAKVLSQPSLDERRVFVNQQLRDLTRRREELESGIIETESAIAATKHAAATSDTVRAGL